MTLPQVINLIGKGLDLIPTVADIAITIKNKKNLTTSQKVDLAAQIIYTFFQGVDVAFNAARLIMPERVNLVCKELSLDPKEVTFTLAVTSGATDVARKITKKIVINDFSFLDLVDAIGIVVFRASDVVTAASQLDNLSDQDKKTLEWIGAGTSIAGTAAGIGTTAFKVYKNKDTIHKASRIIFLAIKRFICRQPNELPVIVRDVVHNDDENDFTRNGDEIENKHHQLVYRICHWEALDEIPEEFHQDPEFSKHKCVLSEKPIRHPVGPMIHNRFVALYERKKLLQWMNEHPNEKPPKWPENHPFLLQNVMTHLWIKNVIEDRLKYYSGFMKQELNNINFQE